MIKLHNHQVELRQEDPNFKKPTKDNFIFLLQTCSALPNDDIETRCLQTERYFFTKCCIENQPYISIKGDGAQRKEKEQVNIIKYRSS